MSYAYASYTKENSGALCGTQQTPFVYYGVIVLGKNKALLDRAYQMMFVCHLSLSCEM